MGSKKIAEFVVRVYRESNGDLRADFERPDIQALEKYDYYRLLLLAGELISHVKNQIMYVNVDPDNKIHKMANVLINDDMWQKMLEDKRLEDEKGKADVVKYQRPLPWSDCKHEQVRRQMNSMVCVDCGIKTSSVITGRVTNNKSNAEEIQRQDEADDWADNGFDDGEKP